MGLLFWKNNAAIDAFADASANDLYSYIQPDVAGQHFAGITQQSKKKQRKIEQKLADVVNQMQRFSEANSLGVYGKARLQRTFSERLQELGYDPAVTKQLVEIILFRIS